MDSIKIENGHSAISGSSVRLRTKFIKHFPSLQIQQNVIQTIENLNSSSILDIFKFLMKACASEDYLAQETHLEWAELTQEQSKMIWNEIRSQINSTKKLFSNGEIFENTCKSFVEVWESGNFDMASSLLQSIVKYLDSHNSNEVKRVIFLLQSTMPNHAFGGIREIGYSYEEATKFVEFSYQAYCLAEFLFTNYAYFTFLPLLPYLEENVQSETLEVAEETSKFPELENTKASNFEEASIEVSSFNRFSLNKGALDFSTDGVVEFIKNYELFKGFLVAVGGLREIQVDPQFVLDNEDEFGKLIDIIDRNFQKK